MTYKTGKCSANCSFCPQARGSQSKTELLSRVTWPTFSTMEILNALKPARSLGVKRVCIQALNYPDVFLHLEALVKEIKKAVKLPVSVSCQPFNHENILQLKNAGVNRLGIALDAATETVFQKVKGVQAGGVYIWSRQFSLLKEALTIFGVGNVSTHLIVGLGETEKQAAAFVQMCVGLGVLPALFAFTPVHGTALENTLPPSLESYRRVQLARYLLVQGVTCLEQMHFDEQGKITGYGVESMVLEKTVATGRPFQTSGCPDCNRPYYNEKPSGPMYNYPKKLTTKDLAEVKQQLKLN